MRLLSGLEETDGITPADRRFWLFLAGCYVIWTVWGVCAVLYPPLAFYPQNAFVRQCCSSGVRLALVAGPAWFYLHYIDRVTSIKALRLRAAPKNMWQAVAIGLLVLGVICLELVLLEGKRWQGLDVMTAAEWAGYSTRLMIAMIAEETMFRGFIYRKLRSAYAVWRANIMSSLLFVFIHWPGWLFSGAWNSGLIGMSLSTFVCGAAFALVFEVTGSLWAVILLHFLSNVCCRLLAS